MIPSIITIIYRIIHTLVFRMITAKQSVSMDKMLEVFLDENVSEYFFYKENGKWVEELK